jgi:hypothetical protein
VTRCDGCGVVIDLVKLSSWKTVCGSLRYSRSICVDQLGFKIVGKRMPCIPDWTLDFGDPWLEEEQDGKLKAWRLDSNLGHPSRHGQKTSEVDQ